MLINKGMIIKKIIKFLALFLLLILGVFLIVEFELNNWIIGSSLGGVILGLVLPSLGNSIKDLSDNTSWKTSQRKLMRGKIIKNDDWIRISFAYLFRIKVNGKYFLVKNARKTEKFQPVGGAYKMNDSEKNFLKKKFNVEDDNKIIVDSTSKNDYRLRIKNYDLRKFVKRFDKTHDRENLYDLSREFKEEVKLIDGAFDNFCYRYCGRHMTDLQYSKQFQCYELLLADVVEVYLNDKQINYLQELTEKWPQLYMLADDSLIKSLGIVPEDGKMQEIISDHTEKILIENEDKLMNKPLTKEEYTVKL